MKTSLPVLRFAPFASRMPRELLAQPEFKPGQRWQLRSPAPKAFQRQTERVLPPEITGNPQGAELILRDDWGGLGTNWGGLGLRHQEAGLGYHPDLPDWRDFNTFATTETRQMEWKKVERIRAFLAKKRKAASVDESTRHSRRSAAVSSVTRFHLGDDSGFPLPPVEDQGHFQSCTANAVISMVEFLFHACTGEQRDFSRHFLYHNTRRLLGWEGDCGGQIRATIKALRVFGVLPESDWPYDEIHLEARPEAYHYAYAQNFKSLSYSRLDCNGNQTRTTLESVRQALRDGFPVAFGFPVYDSIARLESTVISNGGSVPEAANAIIPLPKKGDKLVGGHAMLAVGYDDSIPVRGQAQPGALIIRNSWGQSWGDMGYGYLPYDYAINSLAVDFWTIYDSTWLGLKSFEPK